MSFDYSGDPGASDKDGVRFILGDTDESDPLLTDEEINRLLEGRSKMRAAILGARRIAAKYSRFASEALGSYREEAQMKAENYRTLAEELKAEMRHSGAEAFAAIFDSDKDVLEDDGDWIEPRFERGQFDNDRAD